MFHKKIDELFNGMPNISGIADAIILVGFDEISRDHDATLDMVLNMQTG